jgi:hypothetical protein
LILLFDDLGRQTAQKQTVQLVELVLLSVGQQSRLQLLVELAIDDGFGFDADTFLNRQYPVTVVFKPQLVAVDEVTFLHHHIREA